jgi:hypothetical protein
VLELPFSDKKIIPWITKQDGTDGSSVGIPPVSRKRKTSEFRSEPFLGRGKPLEFRSKPFSNDNTLEFLSKPFSEEKTSEFQSEPFSEQKKNSESIPNHFWNRKHLKNDDFVSCFVKLHYFRGIPFRSVRFRTTKLALLMNTEFRGMSTFFRGITKTVPSLFRGIFPERNFDGNPNQCTWMNTIVIYFLKKICPLQLEHVH